MDEYERIKQAEKEHLRALKALKAKVRRLEQRRRITDKLGSMAGQVQDKLNEHADALEALERETALREARLEEAMRSSPEEDSSDQPTETLDEELARVRARRLVEQMRSASQPRRASSSSSSSSKSEPSASASEEAPDAPSSEASSPSEDSLPEKTIGRMRR